MSCRKIYLALSWCLIGQFASAQSDKAPAYERIASSIRAEIAAERLTGVSVALVQDGRILWEEGFGWADREARRKATSRTPFSIASTTKPITTTALMALVSDGKVNLDVAANEYLGPEKIRRGSSPARDVTLRHLASHSAGLPTFFEMYAEGQAARPPSIAEVVRDYGYAIASPGSYYEYSNLAFGIVADVIARRSGLDFGSYLKSKVFTPLGMSDSFIDTDPVRRDEMAARYADDGSRLPFYLTATPGSGAVYSSAHDLAKFASLHLKSDLRSRVLAASQIDELHRPVTHIAPNFDYAMGWQIYTQPNAARVLYHGGGQSGVAAEFVLVPGKSVACIVLSNRRGGQALRNVRDAILRSVIPEWQGIPPTPEPRVTPIAAASGLIGTWRGTLLAQGRSVPIELRISSPTNAALAIDAHKPMPVAALGLADGWLSAETRGDIGSPDVRREKLDALVLNLKPGNDRLEGEIIAWRKTSASMTMLPHWTELERVDPASSAVPDKATGLER